MTERAKLAKFIMWLQDPKTAYFINQMNELRRYTSYESGSEKVTLAELIDAYYRETKTNEGQ
ncbi:MAG TPA: hypothetical protein PLN38_04875 [Chitinophagales bacterium]|nr:hypothetical protein [Chitinophagales bacterium]